MLYHLREAQRAVLQPLASWADSMGHLYGDPYSPLALTPFANRISAGFELLHRLGKEYEKPEFGLSTTYIEGLEVPVAERVEIGLPFCRLLKFERLLPKSLAHRASDPVVLVFAPLSGHHATLLRDTVRALLPDHNVYITDWIDARMVSTWHGPFTLDDYVGYSIRFMRHLAPDLHVLAVCQPTVPVMAAVSLMAAMKDPHMPSTMTLMGGPLDTSNSPTRVNDLATTRSYDWFERVLIHRVPSRYPGSGRRVYPGFLQRAGFVSMNPDRHMISHWDFYLDLVRGDLEDAEAHRRFYDEYNAVLDMPAEYYLDTIRTVFQERALANGTWDVEFEGRLRRVEPDKIRDVALFTIEGELDDISGPGQTEAAHSMCSGIPAASKSHLMVEGAGHYGIFSGRRWRQTICPEIRAFIAANRRESQLRLVS